METLRILRNRYFVLWSLVMPIIFYALYTNLFAQSVNKQMVWEKHFLMSMTTFSVMGSSIITLGLRLVEERNYGWTQYLLTMPVPRVTYFGAKMIGQSVIHVFSVFIIFLSGVLINGVSMPVSEWISSGLWIIVGALPFLALGVLIGTMKNSDTASGIGNLLYLTLAVAGGLWMPAETLPGIFSKLATWLPSYHYGMGAWRLVQGHAPGWINIAVLFVYAVLFMILSIKTMRRQEAF